MRQPQRGSGSHLWPRKQQLVSSTTHHQTFCKLADTTTNAHTNRPAHTPWQLPSWRDLVPRRISISGGVKGGGDDKETECDDPAFRKHQLSYIKEMPFIGLFDDVRATTK